MMTRLGCPMSEAPRHSDNPEKILTTFMVPADLHTRLKAQGALEETSMTRLVIEFIEVGLEERGASNKHRLDSFVRLMGRASA